MAIVADTEISFLAVIPSTVSDLTSLMALVPFGMDTIALPGIGFAMAWTDISGDFYLRTYDYLGNLEQTNYILAGSFEKLLLPQLGVSAGKIFTTWMKFEDFSSPSPSPSEIHSIYFDYSGGIFTGPDGLEVTVAGPPDQQIGPINATLTNGDFASAWVDIDTSNSYHISAAIIPTAGLSVPPTAISVAASPSEIELLSVTALTGNGVVQGDGGFAVAWSDYDRPNQVNSAIYTSAFEADGNPVNAIQVNQTALSLANGVFSAALSNERFVMVWGSDTSFDSEGISFRIFNNNGTAFTGQMQANTETADQQIPASVTALSDGFVVAWATCGCTTSAPALRIFNNDGSARTDEIKLSDDIDVTPSVIALEDGTFAAVWSYFDNSSSPLHSFVALRQFSADGDLINSADVKVEDSALAYAYTQPELTLLDDGSIVANFIDAYGGYYNRVFHFNNDAPTAENNTLNLLQGATHVVTLADLGYSDVNNNDLAQVYVKPLTGGGQLLLNGSAVTTATWVSASDISSGNLKFIAGSAALSKLSFRVQDDGGTDYHGFDTSNQHTLTFNVTTASPPPTPSHNAPTSADNAVTTLEDVKYAFTSADFPFSDADSDRLSVVTITALPSTGTLSLNGSAVGINQPIAIADILAGKLVWTPPANLGGNGLATLSFTVRDDSSATGSDTSTTHTLTINVTAVNDAPTAQDATVTAFEDTPYAVQIGDFGFADVDNAGLKNVIVTGLPLKGTLTLNGSAVTLNQAIAASDITAGKLIWTPPADANGNAFASFAFKLQDAGGTANGGSDTSTEHRLTFDLAPVNDAPTAADATIAMAEDSPHVFAIADFGFADGDGNAFAAAVMVTPPATGTLMLNGVAVTASQAVQAADIAARKLVWTPPANVNGPSAATLAFKVMDDGGTGNGGQNTSTQHTLTFDIAAVNDAPLLAFGPASTPEDKALTMDVLSEATDADGDTLTITAASVSSGFGSAFVKNGQLVYDPTTAPNQDIGEGESRTVTVHYTVSDGHGGVTSAAVTVTVDGISPDIFRGTNAGETLVGSSGDDRIYGLGGRDLLNGRTGADRMEGGKGNDVYLVDNRNDTVIEDVKGGNDLVRASVSFTLGANVEKLVLTGSGDIDARGNDLDNSLTGNRGDNLLWGGVGADRLEGGKGADIFQFRDAGESTVDLAGRDAILDFSHHQHDRIDLHFIDANEDRDGNQAFKFIGGRDFHGKAGELHVEKQGGDSLVLADTDGDGSADLAMLVANARHLAAGDFLL